MVLVLQRHLMVIQGGKLSPNIQQSISYLDIVDKSYG